MKEFIEAKKKELSLRLYAYYGKVVEDNGNEAEEFERNCLAWFERILKESYQKGIDDAVELVESFYSTKDAEFIKGELQQLKEKQ